MSIQWIPWEAKVEKAHRHMTLCALAALAATMWTMNFWMDWFKGKKLQETIDFPIKYGAFLQIFP